MVSVSRFRRFSGNNPPSFKSPDRGVSNAVFSSARSNTRGSTQGLAVAWSNIVIFDLVVVVMTLVRTIQINRRSVRDHTLTHLLIRDGENIDRTAFEYH